MPLDPIRVAEARAWFLKAAEDLRAGTFELGADPPLSADVAFHSQQAVEKSIKGFLSWHGRPLRKTHNLVELGEACASIEPALEELLRRAAPLTEYAWKFRYPGEADIPGDEEARNALSLAREVWQALLDRLPEGVRP